MQFNQQCLYTPFFQFTFHSEKLSAVSSSSNKYNLGQAVYD